MILLGVANFVLIGPRQWSSWVLVVLGSFSVFQAWRNTKKQAGDDRHLLRIRWPIMVGFLVGALVVGAVIGAIDIREPAALAFVAGYVAVGVAVVLIAGQKHQSQGEAGTRRGPQPSEDARRTTERSEGA